MKYYKAKLNNLEHYKHKSLDINLLIDTDIIIMDIPHQLLKILKCKNMKYYIPEINHVCQEIDFEYVEEIKDVTNEFLLKRLDIKINKLLENLN